MNRYHKLSAAEDEEGGVELEGVSIEDSSHGNNNHSSSGSSSSSSSSSSSGFEIKVLYKERQFDIADLYPNSSIYDLKMKMATLTEVPIGLQRFIFAGKQLKPDDKPLSFFNIVHGSKVHLFPIPAMAPVAQPAVDVTAFGGVQNALHRSTNMNNNNNNFNNVNDPYMMEGPMAGVNAAQVALDPRFSETPREVKLGCMILLFFSSMDLFNNLTMVTSTGKLYN